MIQKVPALPLSAGLPVQQHCTPCAVLEEQLHLLLTRVLPGLCAAHSTVLACCRPYASRTNTPNRHGRILIRPAGGYPARGGAHCDRHMLPRRLHLTTHISMAPTLPCTLETHSVTGGAGPKVPNAPQGPHTQTPTHTPTRSTLTEIPPTSWLLPVWEESAVTGQSHTARFLTSHLCTQPRPQPKTETQLHAQNLWREPTEGGNPFAARTGAPPGCCTCSQWYTAHVNLYKPHSHLHSQHLLPQGCG